MQVPDTRLRANEGRHRCARSHECCTTCHERWLFRYVDLLFNDQVANSASGSGSKNALTNSPNPASRPSSRFLIAGTTGFKLFFALCVFFITAILHLILQLPVLAA